jgi:parallel beta-helix repeat protein
MNRISIYSIVLVMLVYAVCWPTIINIPGDYPTIQQGIDASADGDTVLVQPGTYVENINFNGHNIVLGSLFLTTGYPSYVEQTVIDGNHFTSVVIFESGESNDCKIKGFTIRNGYNREGGGIHCSYSSPEIANNIIRDNIRTNGGSGGGIYCNYSDPVISDNEIRDNVAGSGGGISCLYSNPTISENFIWANTANQYWGAGISCWRSNVSIVDNAISDNISDAGGGISCRFSTSLISGNWIERNYADWDGGGLYFDGGTATVVGNNIIDNITDEDGGGIDMNSLEGQLIGNLINGNYSYERGGGICAFRSNIDYFNNSISFNNSIEEGGGIYCWGSSDFEFYNNVISQNITQQMGGGIYSEGSRLFLINNTIYANWAVLQGGGIWGNFNTLIIKNSIIRNNTPSELHLIGSIPSVITYCDISGGWEGTGNIDVSPGFRGSNDFRLKSISCGYNVDSPCIDAGHPEILDSLLDCSWGLGGSRSDMGAYSGGSYLPHNGVVINVPGDYLTIQEAINYSEFGDTVLVHPGTYTENLNFYWHYITLGSLFMVTGDTSYISSTIVDGDSSGSVMVIADQNDGINRIVGLNIRNGGGLYGGGISCVLSNLTTGYNIFENNRVARYGGGIYCYNSDIIIEENKFINNDAAWSGGGIYSLSDAEIINNTFIDNSSGIAGGAVGIRGYGSIISGNIIDGNTAPMGAGIHCEAAQMVNLNIIRNNTSGSYGGGISFGEYTNLEAKENIIQNNSAAYGGGGVYAPEPYNLVLTENIIDGNSSIFGAGIYTGSHSFISGNQVSNNEGLFGAGIYCPSSSPAIYANQIFGNMAGMRGAGVYCYENSNPQITSNLIINNSGNGICLYHSYPDIIGNVIFGNNANIGGGLYNINSRPSMINTIIWGNYAPSGAQILVEGINEPILEHCDIQGGWPGGGNIDVDPLFRDPANGDFHLMSIVCGDSADSPCIDTGHPAITDSLLDCDWGLSTILGDMGAYGGGNSVPVPVFGEGASIPTVFSLAQNYPNPFNAQTKIRFVLPEPQDVQLMVYDLLGRRVETIIDEERQAGQHQVTWDASGHSSGIYFYRIEAGDFTETKKMILLK